MFIICHDLSAKGPNCRWMQQNTVLHKLLVCNCGQCVNLLYWFVLSCFILSDIETNECLENNGGCWQDKSANLTACKVIRLQLVPVGLISIWSYMSWQVRFNHFLSFIAWRTYGLDIGHIPWESVWMSYCARSKAFWWWIYSLWRLVFH